MSIRSRRGQILISPLNAANVALLVYFMNFVFLSVILLCNKHLSII
uniref:Uncharacterized protein n=1 Tax=Arundo donax TaxID=35708 RepID=A0A0A9A7J8_ARUDO